MICPIGTDEEAATVNKAFVDLKTSGLSGAREHLKAASAELSAGNFSDSIRESIPAVESVVRVLEPSGDFTKALAKLESKVNIMARWSVDLSPSTVFRVMSKAYAMRCSIKAPAVDEVDATFMIGACSAFVSYLINNRAPLAC